MLRLRTKIILLLVFTVSCTGFLSARLISWRMLHAFEAEQQKMGTSIARTVADLLLDKVVSNEIIATREKLTQVVEESSDLAFLYVIDFEGRPFAHTFANGFPRQLLDSSPGMRPGETKKYQTEIGPILEVSVPLINGMQARMHAGMAMKSHLFQVNDLQNRIFLLTGVAGVIGILIAFFISHRVTRPLETLTEAIRSFGKGLAFEDDKIQGGKEVTRLTAAFREMVGLRRRAEKEKEQVISELQAALDEIKTLRGILPLCSFCKKIRNDRGYWEQVDVYIHEHSEADVSHGICPDCLKENYPDYYESVMAKKETE